MHTLIKIEDFTNFINSYPALQQFENEIILTSNDQYHYLPPKFYNNYPHNNLIRFTNKEFKEKTINITFTQELRPYQKQHMQFLRQLYNKNNKLNGIFSALTGYGKSVCAAYISSFIKKKTLIILDNSKLLEQWIDELCFFTNFEKEDIGIIKGKSFQLDKPISIAMVQTLMSKVKKDLTNSYELISKAGYGLVIFDECHKTSSGPKFASSTLLLDTKNIIGLSATPFNTSIHKILMENSIGKVICEARDYILKPKIVFVKYASGISAHPNIKNLMFMSRDIVKGQAIYNSMITDFPIYFNVILYLTAGLLKNNHRVMIIASTVKQVTLIAEFLKNNGVENVNELHGKQPIIDKEKDMVIVGTYRFCSHGFSYAELSALIIASPFRGKTSLIQMIGRILRQCENKPRPMVYDLCDTSFPKLGEGAINSKKKLLTKEFKLNHDELIEYRYQDV